MSELLYVEEITFEDCGTMGGRTFISAGTEYQVLRNTTPENMMAHLLIDNLKKQRAGKTFYPFTRIAIFGIFLDGRVFAALTDENTLESGKYSRFSPFFVLNWLLV